MAGAEGGGAGVRVVAAVLRRDGRFLVARRPAHKRHGGLWEFPGGKVLPGESDCAAVARELREELALRVVGADAPLFTARDPGSPFEVAFLPVEAEGDPHAVEHEALAWATPAELARLPLAPADRRFVDDALAR